MGKVGWSGGMNSEVEVLTELTDATQVSDPEDL